MKKYLIPLISLIFASCSFLSPRNQTTYTKRTPASTVKNNSCHGTMGYLLAKRRRSQQMGDLIKAKDLGGIKELFWQGHMAERIETKKPYTRFYRRLRRYNQSNYVPALFQTKNKFAGDVDTFSTVFSVVDNKASLGADEAKAVEDILGWVEHVTNYKSRFNSEVEIGVEHRLMLNELQGRIGLKGDLKRSDFPKELNVPIVENGEVRESVINFDSIDDLKDFIKEKEKEVSLSFTQNVVDEVFKKSRLYHVMIDQALYVRRLELVAERISKIPEGKLNPDQITLKQIIEETLSDPYNQARRDAMDAVRKKEYRSEFFASLRFWRSRRVENQAKYKISSDVLEKARALSPYGMMMRSAAILTITTGAIITPITIIYDENPWVMFMTSYVSNYFNDFLVFGLGLPSSALSECYRSERPWSIEEASSMNNFIESHLSRYTAMQRIDPSYDPNDDTEYVAKKLELQAMCSNYRLKFKAADRHVENKALLNEHGYRFAVHMILVELVEQQKGKDVASKLYDYFEADEVFEDREMAQKLLKEITSVMGEDFKKKLLDYQVNIKGVVPRVRNGDFDFYYPSLEEFFKLQ